MDRKVETVTKKTVQITYSEQDVSDALKSVHVSR